MNKVQYRQYLSDKVKQCKSEGFSWIVATTDKGLDLRIKIIPFPENFLWGNLVYKHKGQIYLGWLNQNLIIHHGELFDNDISLRLKGTFPKCRYLRSKSELACISEIHIEAEIKE